MAALGKETRDESEDEEDEEEWEDEEEGLMREITREEMKKAKKGMKRGKACGLDDIPIEFILEGGQELENTMREIFNEILVTKKTPDSWKVKKGKLLHKGKERTSLDNYRGISIGSAVGKLFTKIIGNRLYERMERENWMGEVQGGFREDRGTMDNAFIVSQLIERARSRKGIYNTTEGPIQRYNEENKNFNRVYKKYRVFNGGETGVYIITHAVWSLYEWTRK